MSGRAEVPRATRREWIGLADAFIKGLQLTAAISAIGSIGLAVFVTAMLRHAGTRPEPEEQLNLEPAGTIASTA